jgi:hypothetical protein
MGFAKIHGRLTSRINRPVRYGAPKDVQRDGGRASRGIIVDEVWADPAVNDLPARRSNGPEDWGDYSFCAQRIKWNDNSYSIRLAYFRRRAGEDHWEFASQMTVSSHWSTIKTLLEVTLNKSNWFADEPEPS